MPRGVSLCCLAVMLVAGTGELKLSGAETSQPGLERSVYEEPSFIIGAIYGQGADGKQPLFEIQRRASRIGARLDVQREYTDPDGQAVARERVVYDGNDLVRYELQELQIGAEGIARIRRDPGNPAKGSIEFEYGERGGRPKRKTEGLSRNTLVNDMVGPFLTLHWDALVRGEKVGCRYLVVPRCETIGFTFVKVSESVSQNRDVIIVKMAPSSLFVSAWVEPLFFTMEVAPPHRVLQYIGRTTPMIRARGKWEVLDAVTVFDWSTAR